MFFERSTCIKKISGSLPKNCILNNSLFPKVDIKKIMIKKNPAK